jgi:hypothetical protein
MLGKQLVIALLAAAGVLLQAEKRYIPCVENTNVDRSVALIHLSLLG